ncbi:MAG: amidohydrolase family protein [Phycisphaerales bacterium]|jgi:predicted TIM-barrel fold metal-dependent hydrolase|nr:amidohydrolase family protein [Phycisphaerales bacterium]
MPIIDIHTHPEPFGKHQKPWTPDQAIDLMLRHMDHYGVQYSGLLGYDVMPGQDEASVRIVNDFTAKMVTDRPDRFFGFAFINPTLPAQFVDEELERCLSISGFGGIKLEVDVNCRSPLLDRVMKQAIRFDVPVLHHSWSLNLWNMPDVDVRMQQGRSEPHDVADLARRFPNAKIIMAHLEGCGQRGILDIADLPNVWIDTSGSQPFTGTLEFAIQTLGSGRILFGTDMMGRGMPSQLGRILGSRLSDEDRNRILFRNAQSLFNLQPQPTQVYANH